MCAVGESQCWFLAPACKTRQSHPVTDLFLPQPRLISPPATFLGSEEPLLASPHSSPSASHPPHSSLEDGFTRQWWNLHLQAGSWETGPLKHERLLFLSWLCVSGGLGQPPARGASTLLWILLLVIHSSHSPQHHSDLLHGNSQRKSAAVPLYLLATPVKNKVVLWRCHISYSPPEATGNLGGQMALLKYANKGLGVGRNDTTW